MKTLLSTLSLLALCACATSGVRVDQSKLSQLHKNETTYAEALQLLGNPSNVMVSDDGSKTAIYVYASSQVRPETFIPIVGSFVGGADSETTSTTLMFDKNGILQHYNSNQGSMGTGTGLESYSTQRTPVKGE